MAVFPLCFPVGSLGIPGLINQQAGEAFAILPLKAMFEVGSLCCPQPRSLGVTCQVRLPQGACRLPSFSGTGSPGHGHGQNLAGRCVTM